mmetsp:Transcript_23677/g.75866  ORF Transcript_23677/g.75866 Transcript_23677/m.75866 type:complete len:287 (+) Transcript_23677:318-1178(+)
MSRRFAVDMAGAAGSFAAGGAAGGHPISDWMDALRLTAEPRKGAATSAGRSRSDGSYCPRDTAALCLSAAAASWLTGRAGAANSRAADASSRTPSLRSLRSSASDASSFARASRSAASVAAARLRSSASWVRCLSAPCSSSSASASLRWRSSASSASIAACASRPSFASPSSLASRASAVRSSEMARSSEPRASLSSASEAPSTRRPLARPSSTLRTRMPNSSEQRDSEAASADGLMLTNMKVLELPPSESASSCVSLESRKGTCFAFSCSLAITLPSAERLLLMA